MGMWGDDVDSAITGAASKYGLSPELMRTFAKIESSGRPDARTGSYKGLFQLSDSEFTKHGGSGNIFDPQANANAAAQKLAGQTSAFKSKYGRDPTPNDLYMIHQQGEGGYAAHTRNPSAPAWQNMASTLEGRQKGDGWARQAIWGNVPSDVRANYPGGVDSLTSQQFLDLWNNKVNRIGAGTGNMRPTLQQTMAGGGGYIGGTAAAPAQTGGQPMPPEALVQPSGRYSKLADMLLASGAGAKPKGWGELLNAGGDLALGYTLSNKEDEAQKQYRSKLAEALGGAGDREALVNTLMTSGDPDLMKAAISEKLKPPAAPQAGRYKAVEGGGVLDTATGEYVVPPPSGGDASGLSPVAEKERQKAIGKAQGESAAGLPVALQSGEALVSGIDDLLEDPKLPSMTGPFDSWLPNLSGNAARVQSKLDKVQGQTFLQAYEKLKGGGVITEIEGQKAEQALNRLQSLDQNDADYVDALKEFRNEVGILYDIAQERAGVPQDQRKAVPPLPGIDAPQQGGGGQSTGAPPSPAVEFLRSNPTPEIIQQFDAKYGAGAAQSILQGQPSPQPQQQPAPQPYGFGVSP